MSPAWETHAIEENQRSPFLKRKKSPICLKSANSKKKVLTIQTKFVKDKIKLCSTSSSSDSGSSQSSASESDSDSRSSTSGSLEPSPLLRTQKTRLAAKPLNEKKKKSNGVAKKRVPISIEIKKNAVVGASALTSPINSIQNAKDSKKSRREELLKQLRAVEDAIAKKRSKLT